MGDRLIGIRQGEAGGPLFIAIGQMHGNEPAGTEAIRRLFELIDIEYLKNPAFQFKGTVVGLCGNVLASQKVQRFIDMDLNRIWKGEDPMLGFHLPPQGEHPHEFTERFELFQAINALIKAYPSEQVFLLDLHTTTAQGGVFAIPGPGKLSMKVAYALHSPIIDKLLDDLPGTLVKFISRHPWDSPVSALVFESGQHEAADSVNHAISALINCMRTLKMVQPEEVEHKHDQLLVQFSQDLPKLTELVYRHRIRTGDGFWMKPGFSNFMPVRKGELLAWDNTGEIRATHAGLVLMPLYQRQGEDGFFIVIEK